MRCTLSVVGLRAGGPRRPRVAPSPGPDDRGFTLVELLIVVVLLGVVVGALGAAFGVTARDSVGIRERFGESHDAQIASSYLATDVQSSQVITASVCGAPGLTPVVNFSYDGASSIASWYYGASGGETRLRRLFCDGNGTETSDVVLVHNGGGTPAVACDGSACNPATTPRPSLVTITIPEFNSSTGSSDFTYSLTGSRRVFVVGGGSTPGPVSGYPPLLVLGSSGLLVNGNHAGLHVNGGIIVDAGTTGAVRTNSSEFTYGSLQILGPGTCATCAYTNRSNAVPDPLAGLPAPSSAGLPVDPAPQGSTYSPGVYTTQFSPTGTLSPGVYVLQAGFNLNGQQAVVGDGVLIYVTGGSFTVSGQATLRITAPTSGTYAGISIWQAASDTNAFSIAGNGGASSVGGLIYAPGASSVTLGTGNGGLIIGSVIAPNVNAGGNGGVCIGYPSTFTQTQCDAL
jgi:prepilin-type N-terminal cleavage/methylation domain-containing protein